MNRPPSSFSMLLSRHTRRREFIAGLGGMATIWPLAVRAQEGAVPVIGYFNSATPDGFSGYLPALRRGLKESGYVEGENVVIEYRWAENQPERLPELAAGLVRRQVKVIAAQGAPASIAAGKATATIPIVFGVPEDPVRLGLVASLAHPGGNATGVNFFFGPSWRPSDWRSCVYSSPPPNVWPFYSIRPSRQLLLPTCET